METIRDRIKSVMEDYGPGYRLDDEGNKVFDGSNWDLAVAFPMMLGSLAGIMLQLIAPYESIKGISEAKKDELIKQLVNGLAGSDLRAALGYTLSFTPFLCWWLHQPVSDYESDWGNMAEDDEPFCWYGYNAIAKAFNIWQTKRATGEDV